MHERHSLETQLGFKSEARQSDGASERKSVGATSIGAWSNKAFKPRSDGARSVQATGQLYSKRVAQHALGRSVKRQAEGASLISVEHPERVNHETRLNAPSPDGD